MANRYIISSSVYGYGIRYALGDYTDSSGHNSHNTVTKVPFCNNSYWSCHNGSTTARVTYDI